MLIDVHCHLDMLDSPEKAIKNAKKNKVNIIIANSVNPESIKKVLALSQRFPEVKAALGIYPIDALKLSNKELKSNIKSIKENKPFAIGEVGIDFKEDEKEHEKQIEIFKKFIELSKELNVPIIVHSRKAESTCIELLEKAKAKKVIMHYFSGSMTLVKRIIFNNWFLSVPTCVAYAEHFQKVVELSPMQNLFCETDSPYSHPEKKFPNEPANIIESYKKISEIKSLPLEKVEKQIENNFNRLFK